MIRILAVLLATISVAAFAQTSDGSKIGAGSVLPQPAPAFKGKIGTTYKESKPDYPKPVAAPKSAPNIERVTVELK